MTRRSAAPRKDDRTGTWSFIVDLPPGPKGQRRQARRRGFATRKAAQEALDELRVTAREGTFVEASKMTLGAYLEDWLAVRTVSGLALSTAANYRAQVARYIVPALGGLPIQALQPGHLDRFYRELTLSGLSARTVRYVHAIISKALADAARKGLVARNVATLADPPSAKAARAPEMAFWTPAELARFLEATANSQCGALYRLAAMTGMRRGELCALRWGDVDLDRAVLRVRRQLGLVDGKLTFSERPKSDHGRRTVDLDAETVRVLREHRRRQLERRMSVGAGWADSDLVFCGPAGEPVNPDSAAQAFRRGVKRLGLPTLRFHDLRHSHCAHLIAVGRNPREISRRLGHASVSFTLDRYGHLMPEAGAEAAAAVAALVDGARVSGGRS